MQYHNVVGSFFDNTWAIMPEAMPRLVQTMNSVRLDKDALLEIEAARPRKVEAVDGNVAVISVLGPMTQRMSLWQEMFSGGTSAEAVGAAFDRSMADSSVGAIVLNIDSPGGSVYGTEELADKIYNARGKGKAIVAVANSLAASALYWVGSSAEQFYVTPSGEVGSIGVLAMHTDWSSYNEKVGVNPTYIYAGKYKVEGNAEAPLDDEAKGAIQASVDSYYDSFTAAVARNRGVSQRDVKSGFGEGRVVRAKQAVEMGMADAVKTLAEVLGDMTRGQKPRRSASGFAEKRELAAKYQGGGK